MAQLKLNNNAGSSKSLKLGGQNKPEPTTSFKIGGNEEPEPKRPTPEELGMPPAPIVEPMPDPTPEPEPEPEPEEESGKRGRRGKKSGKKEKKPSKRKGKKEKSKEPGTVDEAYKAYKQRKIIVYVTLIVAVLAIVGCVVYATIFRPIPTAAETATSTNKYNGVTQVQSWDTGVDGYLQSNLQQIMATHVTATASTKDFIVTNIAVEKNQQISNNSLISFFSADVVINGATQRAFFMLPLIVKDNKFIQGGQLEISFVEPFSSDATTIEEDPLLTFENTKANEDASKEFEKVLENFLTLGYNSKQDVSNIYKGKSEFTFEGSFEQIDSCTVYNDDNGLGYNAFVEYTIKLPNGLVYRTSNYMKVNKEGSTYVIEKVI